VVKPFEPIEVVARVRADLRRSANSEGEPGNVLRKGEIAIDDRGVPVRIVRWRAN
jgi:DNA-binding response OmpR family regulator